MGKRKPTTTAQHAQFFQPVLDAINALGGSARPAEVKGWIVEYADFDRSLLDSFDKSGESKFSNRVDWARYYLVRSGYLDSSRRGVWSLTERGAFAKVTPELAADLQRRVDRQNPESDCDSEEAPEFDDRGDPLRESHRRNLLNILRSLSPSGFEKLARRVLLEAGFESVDVTGRSGDGGIDGHGLLKLGPLVSIRVLFQCKRFKDSVGPSIVRDFRGAMAGRADKGLILTTGFFSSEARREASRDGAPPIELVDGEALMALLEELELGISPVRAFKIEGEFFNQFV